MRKRGISLSKICCITYGQLDELVRKAVAQIEDNTIELTIIEGLREEIIEGVHREVARGVEIFIGGGTNAKVAGEHTALPVLNYKITDFDLLMAIQKGLQISSKVALITFQTAMPEKLKGYLESQKIQIKNIVYEESQDLEEEVKKSDVDVVIGTAYPLEVASRLGKQVVSIYPGISGIIDTIYDGKLLANEIRKIKEKTQYATTVMEQTTNGVILIDNQEKIIDHNHIVEEILGLDESYLRNKQIGEVIKGWEEDEFKKESAKEKHRVFKIGEQDILEKVIKIGTDPLKFEGAVLIFIKLSDIRKAQLEHEEKERESRRKRGFHARKHFADILGDSYKIKNCISDARIFSKSDASVLIYGETGVGKEIFAQSIHNESKRAKRGFIAINCGAFSESLLEAELFGYDEGAFTGSKKGGKKGLFELADGGTLFLDEIGETSPMMQTRLLRVLQEKEIMRVGGDRILPVDVRIIAATNRDLEHAKPEEFRRDLLYRLNVLQLDIPPLREREEDAVLLFEKFYARRRNPDLSSTVITDEMKKMITSYKWWGNIREMQNVCERYCLYLEQSIKADDNFRKRCLLKAIGEEKILHSLMEKHEMEEKRPSSQLVYDMKEILSYNREKIAEILGISRTTIWRMLKEDPMEEEKESKRKKSF